jgi:hypothetical protein
MAVRLVSESARVRDGAAAGLPGAKVFRAHRSPRAPRRALDQRPLWHRPRRKVLRSLRRADLGAIRRICFRTHVCVLTVGLPDASRQTARPDAGDGWSGGIVLPLAKQTGAQSGGAAGERRARETGKPGCRTRRRGEAAWPNARSARGRYLACDLEYRAGKAVRPINATKI